MLRNQKFITRYVVLLGFEGVFGEIIDYIWVYHAVLLLPEDLGGVIVMFARHLIAFHCAVSQVQEVFECNAFFTEELVSFVFAVLGDIEYVVEIEVRKLTSVH